jgi:putative phosphoribosyl transferase
MITTFRDRKEAGALLGAELDLYRGVSGVVVLGLPRGGVVVASEIANALEAPMDLFTVRKLGVPTQPELAMGAVASGGVRVLNRALITHLGIDEESIELVTAVEQEELLRREMVYRPGLPPVALSGQIVILCDDGLATGSTMLAAVRAVSLQQASRVVVAVPVAAADSLKTVQAEVDEVVYLMTPEPFVAVGQWYEQFDQVGDDEVRELLSRR